MRLTAQHLLPAGALILLTSAGVPHRLEAYTQPASVVDSAGGGISSKNYAMISAVGQAVAGLSSGSALSNYAGFIPVLGAHGLLYPVIGFTPGSFTFTFFVSDPPPVPQGLSLANAGGGTLEWTASATTAWLSLDPPSGSGSGTVTVGILPDNLPGGVMPGIHTDTITIAAAGADNSPVSIPVTLTIRPDFTLDVTFASVTKPAGGGSVTSIPAGIACTGNPCTKTFHEGTVVDLTATPDKDSVVVWSGDCSGGSCRVTMNANRSVTATFSYVLPARITVPKLQFFESLQAAYLAAADGAVIEARDFTFIEDLILNLPKSVTIMGGYDAEYTDRPGSSRLQGTVVVGPGTMVSDRLTVK